MDNEVAEEELTSSMGSVLSSTNKDDKNDASDSTPTSSTDANTTATTSHILTDDPISSTSSDIQEANRIKENVGEVDGKQSALPNLISTRPSTISVSENTSSVVSDADLLCMNITDVSAEKITEDVEDIVQDLENLLGESSKTFTQSARKQISNASGDNLKLAGAPGVDLLKVKGDAEVHADPIEDDSSQNPSLKDNTDSIKKHLTETKDSEIVLAQTVETDVDIDAVTKLCETEDVAAEIESIDVKDGGKQEVKFEGNDESNDQVKEESKLEVKIEARYDKDGIQGKDKADVQNAKTDESKNEGMKEVQEVMDVVQDEAKGKDIYDDKNKCKKGDSSESPKSEVLNILEAVQTTNTELSHYKAPNLTEVFNSATESQEELFEGDTKTQEVCEVKENRTQVDYSSKENDQTHIGQEEQPEPVVDDSNIIHDSVSTTDHVSVDNNKLHENVSEITGSCNATKSENMETISTNDSNDQNQTEDIEGKMTSENVCATKGASGSGPILDELLDTGIEVRAVKKCAYVCGPNAKNSEHSPKGQVIEEDRDAEVEQIIIPREKQQHTDSEEDNSVVNELEEQIELHTESDTAVSLEEVPSIVKVDFEPTAETSDVSTAEIPGVAKEEIPEVANAETPEVASSETLEVASVETPEVATAETPEVATAETPEVVTAETLEVANTEISEAATAETMEVATSETTEAAETPEVVTAETPEVVTAETPEVVTAKTPEVVTAETPEIVTSETPEVVTSETPEDVTSETPEVVTLETPEVVTSETPEVVTSETPKDATAEAPVDAIENSFQEESMNVENDEPSFEDILAEQPTLQIEEQSNLQDNLGTLLDITPVDDTDNNEYKVEESLNKQCDEQEVSNISEDVLANSELCIQGSAQVYDLDLVQEMQIVETQNDKLLDGECEQENVDKIGDANSSGIPIDSKTSEPNKEIESITVSHETTLPQSDENSEGTEENIVNPLIDIINDVSHKIKDTDIDAIEMNSQDAFLAEDAKTEQDTCYINTETKNMQRDVEQISLVEEDQSLSQNDSNKINSLPLEIPSSSGQVFIAVECSADPGESHHNKETIIIDKPKHESLEAEKTESISKNDLDTTIELVCDDEPKKAKDKTETNISKQLTIKVDDVDKVEKYQTHSPKITIKPIKSADEHSFEVQEKEESKGSLKMTITKQSDKMHSILKVYNPAEEGENIYKDTEEPSEFQSESQSVPKLIIKPMPEQDSPLSPKMTTRSSKSTSNSAPRSGSPRITIKPIMKPESKSEIVSPLKITISKSKNEDIHRQKHSPKSSLRSLKSEGESTKDHHSPRKSAKIKQSESQEHGHSPRVTIKPIVKPSDDTEQINPKITIKPIPKPVEISVDQASVSASPRVTIKPVLKPHVECDTDLPEQIEKVSPKITIKPVVKPSESESQLTDFEEAIKERIVLKINKSRKRELSEDDRSEKLAKIKLKFSKEGGHPHIVQQETPEDSHKRSFEEDFDQEKSKRQKIDNVQQMSSSVKTQFINEETICSDDVKMVENMGGKVSPVSSKDISAKSIQFLKEESSDPLSEIPVFEITPQGAKTVLPQNSTIQPAVTLASVAPPVPRKRGRPRKVPLQVREEFKDEPLVQQGQEPQEGAVQESAIQESSRPKRSCRGPSVRTTLGIKPRKPRGAGRSRGGRGSRGSRRGSRAITMKPGKSKNKKH